MLESAANLMLRTCPLALHLFPQTLFQFARLTARITHMVGSRTHPESDPNSSLGVYERLRGCTLHGFVPWALHRATLSGGLALERLVLVKAQERLRCSAVFRISICKACDDLFGNTDAFMRVYEYVLTHAAFQQFFPVVV